MAKQVIEAPRKTVFLVAPESLVLIGLDTKDGPEHPRYDVRVHNKYDEDIVVGMVKFGVKKAIEAVKNGDKLEVVDGRQRVINCREANRRLREAGGMELRVPVEPARGTDAKLFALTILLNEHRIEDTPFGKGQKAIKGLEMGYSEEEVAGLFRVSISTLKNYISLHDLPNNLQQMIVSGQVPATKGYVLAQKGEKAQKAFVEKMSKGETPAAITKKRVGPSKDALRKIIEENKLPVAFITALKFAVGDLTIEQATNEVAVKRAPNPFAIVDETLRPAIPANAH